MQMTAVGLSSALEESDLMSAMPALLTLAPDAANGIKEPKPTDSAGGANERNARESRHSKEPINADHAPPKTKFFQPMPLSAHHGCDTSLTAFSRQSALAPE